MVNQDPCFLTVRVVDQASSPIADFTVCPLLPPNVPPASICFFNLYTSIHNCKVHVSELALNYADLLSQIWH